MTSSSAIQKDEGLGQRFLVLLYLLHPWYGIGPKTCVFHRQTGQQASVYEERLLRLSKSGQI